MVRKENGDKPIRPDTRFSLSLKEAIAIGIVLVTIVTAVLVLKGERTVALGKLDMIGKRQETLGTYVRDSVATVDDITMVRSDVQAVNDDVNTVKMRVTTLESAVRIATPAAASRKSVSRPKPRDNQRARYQAWMRYENKSASDWMDDQAAAGRKER